MGKIEERLRSLGIKLPLKKSGAKKILSLRQVDNLVFLSGHGCEKEDGEPIHRGQVGAALTVEEGSAAARQCGLNLLATLQEHFGSLDRVDQIIKVLGFVNSAPDFYQQPAVMNGFTDLMVEVFGESGRHARSAIGTSVLPNNQAVEIEMVIAVKRT
jgi:enamine deaminase RidA (YjgF/YER057c/UK114 family)